VEVRARASSRQPWRSASGGRRDESETRVEGGSESAMECSTKKPSAAATLAHVRGQGAAHARTGAPRVHASDTLAVVACSACRRNGDKTGP
jgi:hypothetical protein